MSDDRAKIKVFLKSAGREDQMVCMLPDDHEIQRNAPLLIAMSPAIQEHFESLGFSRPCRPEDLKIDYLLFFSQINVSVKPKLRTFTRKYVISEIPYPFFLALVRSNECRDFRCFEDISDDEINDHAQQLGQALQEIMKKHQILRIDYLHNTGIRGRPRHESLTPGELEAFIEGNSIQKLRDIFRDLLWHQQRITYKEDGLSEETTGHFFICKKFVNMDLLGSEQPRSPSPRSRARRSQSPRERSPRSNRAVGSTDSPPGRDRSHRSQSPRERSPTSNRAVGSTDPAPGRDRSPRSQSPRERSPTSNRAVRRRMN